MLVVKVHDNYNLIPLQDLDIDDIEGYKFLKKFRAETSVDMKNYSDRKHLNSSFLTLKR